MHIFSLSRAGIVFLVSAWALLPMDGRSQAADSAPDRSANEDNDRNGKTERAETDELRDKNDEKAQLFDDITTLTEALLLIKKNYVLDKTYREIVYGAIDGMLRELDPHSGFLEPEAYESLVDATRGSFSGIGIQISIRREGLTVISPIEDSPAFHAGVRAGDRIIAIEDRKTDDFSLEQTVETLRGGTGTSVTLTIQRDEDDPFDVTIEREDIKLESIRHAGMLDENIGYVRITQFNDSTGTDFHEALDNLKQKEMQALVLDLRDNPGGLLSSAVTVAEALLPRGTLIVSTRGRDGERDIQAVRVGEDAGTEWTVPIAVLINRGSASGSEIVAGALRDQDRAVLVGERTFGKASVQNVVPLQSTPGCAVRMTTAYYYTPRGRLIHEKGLPPDIAVALKPSEWRRIQLQRMREAIDAPASPGEMDDLPLDRAVEALKAVMIFENDSRL